MFHQRFRWHCNAVAPQPSCTLGNRAGAQARQRLISAGSAHITASCNYPRHRCIHTFKTSEQGDLDQRGKLLEQSTLTLSTVTYSSKGLRIRDEFVLKFFECFYLLVFSRARHLSLRSTRAEWISLLDNVVELDHTHKQNSAAAISVPSISIQVGLANDQTKLCSRKAKSQLSYSAPN